VNVSSLLDKALVFDGVPTGDSQYSRRRAQLLEWLQTLSDDFWLERPYLWQLTSATVTFAAAATGKDLAADFMEVSNIGGLYDDNRNGKPLQEKSPQAVQALQQQPNAISEHDIFAVYKLTSGIYQLQIGRNAAAQSFTLWYRMIPPTLSDDATVTSGLEKFPLQYHYSVLLEGLKAVITRANGADATSWENRAAMARARAVANEGNSRASAPQVMPSNVPGAMW